MDSPPSCEQLGDSRPRAASEKVLGSCWKDLDRPIEDSSCFGAESLAWSERKPWWLVDHSVKGFGYLAYRSYSEPCQGVSGEMVLDGLCPPPRASESPLSWLK